MSEVEASQNDRDAPDYRLPLSACVEPPAPVCVSSAIAKGTDLTATRRTARFAGLLYLVSSLPAPFALIDVPLQVFAEGDAAATAERIRAHADLLRAGIAAAIVGGVLFIFVPLVLYRLFKPTSPGPALAMLVLILISFPISLFSVVNQVAALDLAGAGSGGGSPAAFAALDAHQRDTLAYLALRLHHKQLMVAEIFWGMWLFPFGVCVMRSGFIPRILGVLLMIAGGGYVLDAFAELAYPQFAPLTERLTSVTNFCELPIILWLQILGARPQKTARLA